MAKLYKIVNVSEGERNGREGVWVKLFDIEEDRERQYADFIDNYFEPEPGDVLLAAGVGAVVRVEYKKKGQYTNIVNAELVNKSEEDKPYDNDDPPDNKVVEQTSTTSEEIPGINTHVEPNQYYTRESAYNLGYQFILGLMDKVDKFKKIFKPTTDTFEVISERLFGHVVDIEDYLINGRSPVDSDTKDITKPVDANEPDIPGDDEKKKDATSKKTKKDEKDDIPF